MELDDPEHALRLGGNRARQCIVPTPSLCFAHRQAVLVLKRRAGVGEAPGSSD